MHIPCTCTVFFNEISTNTVILNACLHSSKILSACYLIYWCHQKSQDSWRASRGTTIKAERRCILLWYQHYHIPHGFPEASVISGTGHSALLELKLLLPWEVQQALLLEKGVLWREYPPSQLVVRARLRAARSQLTPLKGTHTHLASYFRLLGYQRGKYSQAPMLFRTIMMMKKKACPRRWSYLCFTPSASQHPSPKAHCLCPWAWDFCIFSTWRTFWFIRVLSTRQPSLLQYWKINCIISL